MWNNVKTVSDPIDFLIMRSVADLQLFKVTRMTNKKYYFDTLSEQDNQYQFDSDAKIERIMFPLTKTLVLTIDRNEFRFDLPVYSKSTMSRVSEEINAILNQFDKIKNVDVRLE